MGLPGSYGWSLWDQDDGPDEPLVYFSFAVLLLGDLIVYS